jgi:hypothetical protein
VHVTTTAVGDLRTSLTGLIRFAAAREGSSAGCRPPLGRPPRGGHRRNARPLGGAAPHRPQLGVQAPTGPAPRSDPGRGHAPDVHRDRPPVRRRLPPLRRHPLRRDRDRAPPGLGGPRRRARGNVGRRLDRAPTQPLAPWAAAVAADRGPRLLAPDRPSRRVLPRPRRAGAGHRVAAEAVAASRSLDAPAPARGMASYSLACVQARIGLTGTRRPIWRRRSG